MTYQVATASNIRKSAFKNVRTTLLNVHADIGTKVYGSFPVTNLSLPLIVVVNGQKQPNEESETLSNISTSNITVIVEIYATMAEKLDTYADAVEAALRTADSTLITNNMVIPKKGIFDNGNISFEIANKQRVHMKSLSVTIEVDI